MVQPNQRIGEYILDAPIGSGAFGEVWRAHHHVWSDQLVAIKIPTEPQYLRMLQREGSALHGLLHPNIARAVAFDPFADPAYLMTEYVPGTSLRPLIKAKQLTPEDAVAIMRQVLAGLSFAHSRGLVHGDIKPENILIHERTAQAGYDVEGDVKVTDFGLGRATRAAATQSVAFSASLNSDAGRHLAGTLDYMAPEQRAGEKIDVRTDLYACGVVLFEMLTGERPAGTDLPSDLVPGLPLFLDKAFRGSYARLDKRFASADAFAQVLARGEAATASIPMPTGHGCPQCRHPVEPGDQFCMHCGTQLVPVVRRCPACDGYPDPANAVCNVCGFDMRRAVHPQRLEA